MADAGTIALGTAFAASLTAMLGYVGTTVASDRARNQRTEEALERCRDRLEAAQMTIVQLRIEYGDSDRGRS
jgi:hypothetical protein